MDRLVFCGGGTTLFSTLLATFRPSYNVLADSQFANAAGYLQFGQWQAAHQGDGLSDVNGTNSHSDTTTAQAPLSAATSVAKG